MGYDGSYFRDKTFTTIEDVRLKSKSKFVYNIAGRVGYVFSHLLAYAKIGYEGRSKVSVLDDDGSVIISASRNGFLLGGGADYAITEKVFLRAEYAYNFGTRKKASNTAGNDYTLRTPTQTILVGAGYRF